MLAVLIFSLGLFHFYLFILSAAQHLLGEFKHRRLRHDDILRTAAPT